jgi:hypothetical protein
VQRVRVGVSVKVGVRVSVRVRVMVGWLAAVHIKQKINI